MIHFEEFYLDNGLQVIVHEDPRSTLTCMNLLYKVGSRNEHPDKTGFAHLFEHLMFGGSKNIKNFDTPLQMVGGDNNAFTSTDITNYYITVPKDNIETAFWLESDRMLSLAFSEEKLAIQKSVVIEEYKQRYLNQPYGDAHLKLRSLHFEAHPYQWPTIGKEIQHIEDATLDDVRNFFFGYYAPNNATMVVAGDVKLDEVQRLAEKWFGPIPRRALKKQELPKEPQQTTAREMTLYGKVPFPAIYKMYHMPAQTDRAYYAVDLMSNLLSSGKSALLYQHMVKKLQVSPGVSAYSWGLHDPGILSIDGKVAAGKTVADYEKALDETLAQLMEVKNEDLERIKGKIAASFIMRQTTILNKAMAFAIYDTLGDPDLVNQLPEIYHSLTLEDVLDAAQTYLKPENCSTLYYLPEEAPVGVGSQAGRFIVPIFRIWGV